MLREVVATCWLAMGAAGPPAIGETAQPDSAPAFSGVLLAEQPRLVVSSAVSPRATRCDGPPSGGVRLSLSLQRVSTPGFLSVPDHVTVGGTLRAWPGGLCQSSATRMALSAAVQTGNASGLAFEAMRQGGGARAFTDARLSYARGGVAASVRSRNVSRGFARTDATQDVVWNAAKDLLGWRQTDVALKWSETRGLTLSGSVSRAQRDGSDERRTRNRLDASWTPSASTAVAMYTETSTSSASRRRTGAVTKGLTLSQRAGASQVAFQWNSTRGAGGDRSSSRRLTLRSRDGAKTAYSFGWLAATSAGRASSEYRFEGHTRDSAPAWMSLSHVVARGAAGPRMESAATLRYQPLGIRADVTAARGGATRNTALHLAWAQPGWLMDLSARRAADPQAPRRDGAFRVERMLTRGARLVLAWTAGTDPDGRYSRLTAMDVRSESRMGVWTGTWRQARGPLFRAGSSLGFSNAALNRRLSLDAVWKRAERTLPTRSVLLKWRPRAGPQWEARWVANPGDQTGTPHPLRALGLAVQGAVLKGLRLQAGWADERGTGAASDRLELGVQGNVGRLSVDGGCAATRVRRAPCCPAWHVALRLDAGAGGRFAFRVERAAQAAGAPEAVTGKLDCLFAF